MRTDADILVVGGGPAGSALAIRAAESGARVRLMDRARFPREKVCGEFLSAEGCAVLDRLGLLAELSPGSPKMDRCTLSSPNGRRLDLSLPPLPGGLRDAMGLSRGRMDHALLLRASRVGVRVEERCEALRPLVEDGHVVGVQSRAVGSGGSGHPLRARLVVAADGRRSVLLRHLRPELGDPRRSGPGSWFGLKTHLTRPLTFGRDRVELHLFRGGYAGLAPVEGDRLNLCLMVTVRALRECGGSPARLLQERILENPAAAASMEAAQPLSRWHSVGPLRFGARTATDHGMLLLGDAAGTVDPFCGEGMSNALVSAEIAAPFVLRAVAGGGLSHELSRDYTAEWRRRFRGVTRRSRWLGSTLQRPTTSRAALWFLRGVGRGLAPRLVAATRTGLRG